jgi:ABC-type branched-subunit amino acid transport system ATPase component
MTRIDETVIGFTDLGGGYGDTQVLRSVSGTVSSGQVLGIIGRNGVGKSTLLRLLTGALPLLSGRVELRGQDMAGWPAHRRQRAGMAYMPQERMVFDRLTVRDNLSLHRSDRSPDALVPLFDIFPRVRERLDLPAGRLSGGEKKLVAFSRVLADSAPLMLLDEPSEGVQQENIEHMARLIEQRCRTGAAFIIVEQNLSLLLAVAQQVIVLDHGEMVHSGPGGMDQREALTQHLLV